uniref:Digestive cysteine proteinase 2 n=1 Tax=Magallana gigas TaxID=29159 RepID=K1PT42_MAGGI
MAQIGDSERLDYPITYLFTFQNGKCHLKASDVGATETSHKDIQEGGESDLQQATVTIDPISVRIDASHSSFQLYRSVSPGEGHIQMSRNKYNQCGIAINACYPVG